MSHHPWDRDALLNVSLEFQAGCQHTFPGACRRVSAGGWGVRFKEVTEARGIFPQNSKRSVAALSGKGTASYHAFISFRTL